MRSMSTAQLLNESRKLAKEYQNRKECKLKIAVLGTYTTQHFVMVLRYALFCENIYANIYEADYGSLPVDILDGNSYLYQFKPNIVILLNSYRDVKLIPQILSAEDEVDQYLDQNIVYYKGIWNALNRISECQILQSNYVIPPLRALGNLEANYSFSENSFYHMLNLEMIKHKPVNVTLVDLDSLASNLGKYNWFDYKAYFLHKFDYKLEYIGIVADLFVRQIKALTGGVRKCLVLDLDNTLWGGVVGDVGYPGIQLDPNHAIGEAYRFFQQYLLKLKNRGVVLAICSKNDINNAKEPFIKNENMILKLNDIACFIANWDDKVSNIKRIASELNIGIDSMVFFDDNPAERAMVSTYLPEIQVIDVPEDPSEYALALEKASPFEWSLITREDLSRSSSYYENLQRTEFKDCFIDYKEYLAALDMKAEIGVAGKEQMDRVVQLFNKTNQFNLRTKRYTRAALEELLTNNNIQCIYLQLKDKFSDYGIVTCAILRRESNRCYIDNWVMSCRVFKRGVEELMLCTIVDIAIGMGCTQIIGGYIRTKKNQIVENLYHNFGFVRCQDILSDLTECDTEEEYYIFDPLNKPVFETKIQIIDNKEISNEYY